MHIVYILCEAGSFACMLVQPDISEKGGLPQIETCSVGSNCHLYAKEMIFN